MMTLSYNTTPNAINNKSSWKSNFKNIEVDLGNIKDVICKNLIYSAGTFKDGYAKDDNFISQNCIIFDIDDGLTLDMAYSMFNQYEGIIATTKSHNKNKNGKVCDRFRIILQTTKKIEYSKEDYQDTMRYIMDYEFPFVDKACKDLSRIYFGYDKSDTMILDGRLLFDFDARFEKAKELKKIEKWKRENTKIEKKDDGTKADWFRQNWKTDKILDVIKFRDKFGEGGRNQTLYAWAKYLKEDVQLQDNEVIDLILWINEQGDSLKNSEIMGTIFKSLRLL